MLFGTFGKGWLNGLCVVEDAKGLKMGIEIGKKTEPTIIVNEVRGGV